MELSGKIKLGVSSCLLGNRVRYDGGHKRDAFICGTLAPIFDLIPYCPENGIGMGTPRRPIHLVERGTGIHAVGVEDTSVDVTTALGEYGASLLGELAGLDGFLLKTGSPSCGLSGVKLYRGDGTLADAATGLFTAVLMGRLPLLPLIDEERLGIAELRESFLEQVVAHRRWRRLLAAGVTLEGLERLHRNYELQLMAHDSAAPAALERLLAGAAGRDLEAAAEAYMRRLMGVLGQPVSRARHGAMLNSLLERLAAALTAGEQRELEALIARYTDGAVTRIAPLTLLNHHLQRHPLPGFLSSQHYLNPAAEELLLHNPSEIV